MNCECVLEAIVCGKVASDFGFGVDVVQAHGDGGDVAEVV